MGKRRARFEGNKKKEFIYLTAQPPPHYFCISYLHTLRFPRKIFFFFFCHLLYVALPDVERIACTKHRRARLHFPASFLVGTRVFFFSVFFLTRVTFFFFFLLFQYEGDRMNAYFKKYLHKNDEGKRVYRRQVHVNLHFHFPLQKITRMYKLYFDWLQRKNSCIPLITEGTDYEKQYNRRFYPTVWQYFIFGQNVFEYFGNCAYIFSFCRGINLDIKHKLKWGRQM